MRFVWLVGTAAALLAPAAIVGAQNNAPQVSIYGQRNYQGPALTVTDTRPDLGQAVPMRSIRVNGGAWQVCERANFTGSCTRFSSSDTDVRGTVRQVRSIRPAPPIGERG